MAISFDPVKVQYLFEKLRAAPLHPKITQWLLQNAPVGTWRDPGNPTIIGDANIFGRLIPGCVFSGGLLQSAGATPDPTVAVQIAKSDFLRDVAIGLGITPDQKHVVLFERAMPAAFWLWASAHGLGEAVPEGIKKALDGSMLGTFLKFWTAQIRTERLPDAPDQMREILIEEDTSHKSLTIVSRDFTGSMALIFKTLQTMGVEIRFLRNFVLPGDGANRIPAYAVSFVFPIETKKYAEFPLSEQGKRDLAALKATVVERLSSLIVAPEEERRALVEGFINRTIPEALSGRSPEEIARRIQWLVEMGREKPACEVRYIDDLEAPRLVIYLNTPFITSSVARICGILKGNGYDVRQMTIDSQDDPNTKENQTLCTFILQRVKSAATRELETGHITPADGALLADKIEALFRRTLGKENLVNILGPIMVGSSSSHTAGAARIGRYARRFIEAALQLGWLPPASSFGLEISMRNTFALDKTGGGHYSADAVVAGLMEKDGGITEENEAVMHDAMKIVAGQNKIIETRDARFSLEPGTEAQTQLQQPRFLAHNPKRLNITSVIDERLYQENQISVRVSDNRGQEIFSVTLNSVGGGIIQLECLRFNPAGIAKPEDPRSELYSRRDRFELSGDKPCYMLKLKPRIEFDLQQFITKLQSMGEEVKEELSGNKLEDNGVIFFAAGQPLSDKTKAFILAHYGELAEIEAISPAPNDTVPMSFSDFKTLKHAINAGASIGEHGFSNLPELAIAYQHAVFGIPEKETRRYYARVMKIMFQSVKAGLENRAPLPHFTCAGACSPNSLPSPLAMGTAGHQVLAKYTEFPISSRQELFDLLNAVFQANKPDPARTFGTDRGARPLDPPQPLSPEESAKVEKYQRLKADPIFHQIFTAHENELFALFSSATATDGGRGGVNFLMDQLLPTIYTELQVAWENDPFKNNVYSLAQAYALAVNEQSAKRGVMVAAPTAGSCGVIPGVLYALNKAYAGKFTPKELTEALMTASVVGLLFNNKLRTSGGNGGCQAEMGAAIAMAAAAATQLMGGDLDQIYNAVAFGLKQVEGLTCTPVGGFVVVPCIKRNGLSAQIALGAAAMAMAGVKSFIDPDCMMDALVEVAEAMSARFRETGKGGCANTPCGRAITRLAQAVPPVL